MTGAALLWLLAGDAQPRTVRPQSSVEVLDSTAQVDDVISRLRSQKADAAARELARDRPQLPDAAPDKAKAAGADAARKDRRRDRGDAGRHDRAHRR
jgi:hypothetical protein